MTTNSSPTLTGEFELRGHDCPLGSYPSMVVPVGTMHGAFVVSYAGDSGPTFQVVRSDVRFNLHSSTTSSTLRGFDPHKHGLFAFNHAELVLYELGEERAFFKRLLRYSPAFYIEPYYRLSLALETEDLSVIRPVYLSCVRYLRRDAPEFIERWITAIAATNEICKVLGHGALKSIEGPSIRRYAPSVAAALESPRSPEPILLPPGISSRINASTIGRAVNEMTLRDLMPRVIPGGPYSKAILLSFGFSESGTPAPDRARPPSVDDVARISGLSLPHLEFLNIILSKTTARQFLNMSEAGIPDSFLSRELFQPQVYERRFARRPTKIIRRLVFTYAELLSLVGYAGGMDLPLST